MAADCNDQECLDARGDSFPLPLPSGPGAGAGGEAGSGGMPGGDAELAGTVREVASQDLVTAQSLREQVEVRAPSASANEDVVAEPATDGTYRLEGIVRAAGTWVGVGHFRDPPIEPLIDTLQAVDSSRAGTTDLFVLQRSLLRDLALSAFLIEPTDFNPEGAHLVIRFEANDIPVPGVEITFPEPENTSIAYDAGDTYSDALTETSSRGTAVLLNLAAPSWPGGSQSINADVAGEPMSLTVQLARRAVTIVTAVVPDP